MIMDTIKNYIDGQFVEPQSGRYLDDIDPATAQPYTQVPDSNAGDVEAAVCAARRAYPTWSQLPVAERSAYLLKIADAIESRMEEFARTECIDVGKPIALARSVDIPRAISNLRFFATAVQHFHSEAHDTDHQALNYTLRRPRGVAGLISPWNLPLYLLTWKIAPALATGNTAVAKPSEITPASAYLLCQVCRDADMPPGVLNIVHGSGQEAGNAIVAHPQITTLSFTGGTRTGAHIAQTAAPLFKKLALEMGGKNPNIIFADADMDEVLSTSVRSAFANQGQICLCGSRVFVERSFYDEFVERFVAATRQLIIGDPLEERTQQGCLVSAQQLEKVTYYVKLATEEGGNILCGGKQPPAVNQRCAQGYFFEPTVITDLGPQCRVNQEEIFGPVVTLLPFDSLDQVVEYANSTPYGLAASVWTTNISRAHRLAEQIDSGTVWVNCWMLRDLRVPFGGMKSSGIGREGGLEALRFFTEAKNVCIKL